MRGSGAGASERAVERRAALPHNLAIHDRVRRAAVQYEIGGAIRR